MFHFLRHNKSEQSNYCYFWYFESFIWIWVQKKQFEIEKIFIFTYKGYFAFVIGISSTLFWILQKQTKNEYADFGLNLIRSVENRYYVYI